MSSDFLPKKLEQVQTALRCRTRKEFANTLGIKESTLNGVFRAENNPGWSFLSGLSLVGVNIDWLMTGEGSMWRVPAQEAVGEALPVEKSSASTQLRDARSDKAFAQGQVEICQKYLGRAQDLLDAKEDLLERTREDLLQAQQQTHDLKANLAQERTWRMQLQKKPPDMLNVPSGEAPVGPLLAPHKPKKEEEKYEGQGDERAR